MYRYLLFCYNDYYPCGGMEDCMLRTNNHNELEQYIHENYEDDYFQGSIHYYDVLENKTVYAELEIYENEDHFDRTRFVGWRGAAKCLNLKLI